MFSETHQPFKTHRRQAVRTRHRGFSLIEIMVVVVIIGMLAGAVALNVQGYMDTANKNRARSDIATIVTAIEEFRLTNGRFPTNEEGLQALPLEKLSDPWKNSFEYNSPGPGDEPYEVICYGADARPGGEDADADIYSWQLDEPAENN